MSSYQQDIAACNEFVQASPENLRRMLLFVVATIQQQLETVPAILASYESDGEQSPHALGFKRRSIPYINANYTEIANTAKRLLDPCVTDAECLAVFTAIPGIGMVKAGFACQLYANRIGCIDRHNVTLYGIPLSVLRYDKTLQTDTLRQKRERYSKLCAGLGGSAFLWRQWCEYVARKRPKNWSNGQEVSIFHPECLTGEFRYSVPDLFDIDYRAEFLV